MAIDKDKYKEAAQGLGLGSKGKDKNRPIGVYLSRDEREAIKAIVESDDNFESRHAFLQYAIRDFVARYKRGKVKLETETVTRLKPPS